MTIGQSVVGRAAVHAALGDPARLAVAEELVVGDVSPRELSDVLGVPSNLLAHHVDVLVAAGLVARIRSEADRRRTYLRLLPPAYPFVQPSRSPVQRVVFVCTQNSARSQLAAALLATHADVPVTSAGTHPAARVHPRAVAIARRHGLHLEGARTRHVRGTVRAGDLVVAVCDRAYEETARGAGGIGGAKALHWSVPDPAAHDNARAFAVTFDNLAERVGRLAAAITEEEA